MNTLFSRRRVFAVDKGEHEYVNVSASAGQIGGGGGGGGGGVEKLCVPNCIVLYSSPVSTFNYQVNLNKLKSQGKELNSASGKIWV